MPTLKTWADETVEVLPCPFCGGAPAWKHIGNSHTKGRKIEIRCPECRVKLLNGAIYHDFSWLESKTLEQWNRRSTSHLLERAAQALGLLYANSTETTDDAIRARLNARILLDEIRAALNVSHPDKGTR